MKQYLEMKFKNKHIGLILGLTFIIFSFLFFGRQQGIYQILLFVGLLISFVFYLTIMFGKETIKSKIIWTIVIVLSALFQQLTEPLLIKSSYLIYLKSNKTELTEVTNILIEKRGEIWITKDTIRDENCVLTNLEKEKLKKLRQKLNVYIIDKSEDEIYYGFWGFLDVRLGITYLTNKNELHEKNLQHLTDNWFH